MSTERFPMDALQSRLTVGEVNAILEENAKLKGEIERLELKLFGIPSQADTDERFARKDAEIEALRDALVSIRAWAAADETSTCREIVAIIDAEIPTET